MSGGGGSLPGTSGGAAAEPAPVQIEFFADNIRPGRSDEDLLTQVLLSTGYELTVPVERLALAGVAVFSVAEGALLVCLSRQLSMEVFEAMIAREPAQIICLDVGFGGNDALKVNAVQAIKASRRSIQFRVL